MPLFDALQNLFDGASEIAQDTVGDALSGVTEAATETTDSIQTAVDNISENLGL